MDAFTQKIITETQSWLGTPYHHQAVNKQVGTDCLGLVRGVYEALYDVPPETPPPYARNVLDDEQPLEEKLMQAAARYLQEVDKATPLAGDVLLFKMQADLPARHLGILVSPLYMIHAAENHCVLKTPCGKWWRRRLAAVFRFPRPSVSENTPENKEDIRA